MASIGIMNYSLKEAWDQQNATTKFKNVIRYTWSHGYLMKILWRLYFGILNRDIYKVLFAMLLLKYKHPKNTTI